MANSASRPSLTSGPYSGKRAGPLRTTTEEDVLVLGAPSTPFRDLYHRFLRASWRAAIAALVVAFLALNGLFAIAYVLAGGVAHARPGSLVDAFYFSVQTMGTIGYGSMYPVSTAANLLVVAQSVTSLIVSAVATGLVFSKFSQAQGRFVFTKQVTIAPMNGVPTLSFRLGNERGNQIVEAQLRLVLVRLERTAEGMSFYRMIDLKLSRDRSPAFRRSWTALHPITEDSPLHGASADSLAKLEAEIYVTVVGLDDTSLQSVHGRHRYLHTDIVWGARHADILHDLPDGRTLLDLTKFHDIVPVELAPTPPPKDQNQNQN